MRAVCCCCFPSEEKKKEMAEHLAHKPVKGILKKTDSIDPGDVQGRRGSLPEGHKEMKWDEMNILATLHPEGKEYGHMKIDEPKTPYSHSPVHSELDINMEISDETEPDSDVMADRGISPSRLTQRLAEEKHHPSSKILRVSSQDEDSDDVDESEMTPEEIEKRRRFREHRKQHYNEFQMMKKAKELLEKEGIEPMDEIPPPTDTSAMR